MFSTLFTRALEGRGHIMPPSVFRKYLKKKRRRAAPPNLGYLHTNQEFTLSANFDYPGKTARSQGQVKIRYALRDRLQTWRSCRGHSFSPNVVKLSGWSNLSGYLQHVYFRFFFFILVTSGQVNFLPGPLQFTPLGGNYSFAHNIWTKGDRRMK